MTTTNDDAVDPAPSDYRPEPQHVSRIAVRLAEQLRVYHDPDWDFSDPETAGSSGGQPDASPRPRTVRLPPS